MNYVFYDFETTGRSSTWDQIIQVGAILVNDTFDILDRFEARCSLKPGTVPEPKALLVNKTTPDMLKKTNLSHFGMVQMMKETFEKWSPAMFIGYNSLSFDEEFLRKTFFKSLTDVYLTNTNGNKRGDILGLVRSAHLYYPECLKTPISEKGNAVFKLDQIASMNGISHDNAHDAMGDVLATMGMAKIIADKAPSVWKASLMTMSKQDVGNIVKKEKLFCVNEYFYGKARPFVVSYICNHPIYNWPQCFDLKNDPEDYFNMDPSVLKEALKKSPKIIRSVKDNKHPIFMNPNYGMNFEGYKQLGLKKLNERAEKIKSNKVFAEKVAKILQDQAQEKEDLDSQLDVQAEETIYSGGFPDEKTTKALKEFQKAEWKDRLVIADKMQDPRYNYFAKKLMYEEVPEILPKDLYKEIHRGIAKRILSLNNEKWNTIPKACDEIDTLRAEYEDNGDEERLAITNDINSFLEEIKNKYQDA